MKITNYKYHFTLILFCVALLLIRIKLTQSFWYLFLIWNLFLAIIPLLISECLKFKNIAKLSKSKLLPILVLWLLFLPNAPYIITDFIHLKTTNNAMVWLDIFMLYTFSFSGIFFAITSLNTIYKIINYKWNTKFANSFLLLATFLCGFGIYLGRFLRFNSWDVFTDPITIIKQSILSIKDPKNWFITISFGLFLYMLSLFFRKLKLA